MKKTILVVDDEADIRDSVKLVLEKEGYAVLVAADGEDCLEKLKTAKPDLILMDVMMPGIPTGEVVKKIKGIKVAFLSVLRKSEAEKEGLLSAKNVIDFIQKPFDIIELAKRVKKLVG